MRIERIDGARLVENLAIANSGFIGIEPEVLLPSHIARKLKLHELVEPEIYNKITGDGREVGFLRYRDVAKIYVVTSDRVEGPVISTILVSPRAKYILLNDKLLSKLKIVLIDFGEGIWCFRDELGEKERKSM